MKTTASPKEIFDSLSIPQRRFLLEKDVSDTKTISEWIEFLHPIVTYDILMDRSSHRLKVALRFLLVMAGFNLLIAILIQSVWIGVLGLVMVGLAAYQWVRRLGNAKRDLDNHLRSYYFPLLLRLRDHRIALSPVTATFHLREKDDMPVVIDSHTLIGKGTRFQLILARDTYNLSLNMSETTGELGTSADFLDFVMGEISRLEDIKI